MIVFPLLVALVALVIAALAMGMLSGTLLALARERRIRLGHPAVRTVLVLTLIEVALVLVWVFLLRVA